MPPDTTTWTDEEKAAFQQSIIDRKGARSIAFADQQVVFESSEDSLRQLAVMRGSRTRYAAHSKGV